MTDDITPAVAAAWQIRDSLPPDVKAKLDALLEGDREVPRD